ncbi:hypothetical protein [Deinococcus radiophilus]|uniref:hypothetical protein n=1 Tax=Deinococcus radiophilus TaxID=32062 RepID=UPI00361F64A0
MTAFNSQPDLAALAQLEHENKACHACDLRAGCLQVVVADGHPAAELLIIGEGLAEMRTGSGGPLWAGQGSCWTAFWPGWT